MRRSTRIDGSAGGEPLSCGNQSTYNRVANAGNLHRLSPFQMPFGILHNLTGKSSLTFSIEKCHFITAITSLGGNEGLEVSVVDEVAIGLAVLGNEHIKIAHQLTALPAGDLMHGIHAVGQVLALDKAVFIAGQIVPLRILCRLIAAGRFQIPAQRKQAFFPVALELSVCFLPFALAMALRRIRKAIRKAGARTT